MAIYFNELIEIVQRKLSNPPNISEDTYSDIVSEAIYRYSLESPRIIVEDIAGTGTFDLSLSDSFIEDFSSISTVEYPYDSTSQTPYTIKETSYIIYRSPSGLVLRLLSGTPSASETVRVAYTSTHSVTVTSSTIPAHHDSAVANLAAGILAEILAAEFAQKTTSTMPDLMLDMRTKAREYQMQADRYYKLWKIGMGLPESGIAAAVGYRDLDFSTSWRRPWLLHPPAYR